MKELYEGIKFQNLMVRNEIPKDIRIHKLIEWCATFHKYNLAPTTNLGSNGNLSFRISPESNSFIISGTQIGWNHSLEYQHFVEILEIDFESRKVLAAGTRLPSSESMLHGAIYSKRSDIQAVFHGHSDILLKNEQKFQMPVTKYTTSYGSIELVNSVLEIIDQHDFLIIKEHGFISLGKNMDDAGNLALKMLDLCYC